jgi:hypothetical protein
MNYATWECICHPSVAKDHDTLKGYSVTTGKAWTEFWGSAGCQPASLGSLPRLIERHNSMRESAGVAGKLPATAS